MFAGEVCDPATHPVTRVKSTDHAVTGLNAVFRKRRRLVAGGTIELLVTEVNAFRRPRSAGSLENRLRFTTEKIFRRTRDHVFRRGKNIPQVIRLPDL